MYTRTDLLLCITLGKLDRSVFELALLNRLLVLECLCLEGVDVLLLHLTVELQLQELVANLQDGLGILHDARWCAS